MIFSLSDHISQIKAGTKTQTRRPTNKYKKEHLYAIQPGRGKPGIPDGKILIIGAIEEWRPLPSGFGKITEWQADAEGGYTPDEYETLYEKMYPNWKVRYAYLFTYFTSEEIDLMNTDPDKAFTLYHSRNSKGEKAK